MIRSYSVRVETVTAILKLLDHNTFRSTTYLARRVYGSANTIACACTQLYKSNLVETKKGANGGYRLKRPLREMTVNDFLEVIPENKKLLRYTLNKINFSNLEDFLKEF